MFYDVFCVIFITGLSFSSDYGTCNSSVVLLLFHAQNHKSEESLLLQLAQRQRRLRLI